jgi:hypothetical protein
MAPATQTQASPQHTFLPRTDGRDTTYTVSLSIHQQLRSALAGLHHANNRKACGTGSLHMLPERLSGCGSLAIKVKNTSHRATNANITTFMCTMALSEMTPGKHVLDKSDVTLSTRWGRRYNDKFYTMYTW